MPCLAHCVCDDGLVDPVYLRNGSGSAVDMGGIPQTRSSRVLLTGSERKLKRGDGSHE